MTETITHGFVKDVERTSTSGSGNPTYRVTLTDGRSFLTEVDGAVGYDAPNFRPDRRETPVEARLTVRRNRIVRMEHRPATDRVLVVTFERIGRTRPDGAPAPLEVTVDPTDDDTADNVAHAIWRYAQRFMGSEPDVDVVLDRDTLRGDGVIGGGRHGRFTIEPKEVPGA